MDGWMDGWMDGLVDSWTMQARDHHPLIQYFYFHPCVSPPHFFRTGLRVDALSLFMRSYKGYLVVHAKDPTQVHAPSQNIHIHTNTQSKHT